jgi:gliding motility-associated lipoprotein GldD
MNNTSNYLAVLLLSILLLVSCREEHYTPKPRTYPKIEFPDKSFQAFEMTSCPFTFEAPGHAEVIKDDSYFNEAPPHPCWFNIHYDQFAADIFLSYHAVKNRKDYDGLISDVYRVVSQVNKRSDFMAENRFINKSGVTGIRFDFEGPAASPIQFFVSDTSQHFLKGALYYNTKVNPDSLAPVTAFIKQDIERMLETFSWE